MQQIAFAIIKKYKTLPPPAARPDFVVELHPAPDQFSLCRVNRIHPQRQMPETGELVVAPIGQRQIGGVNFQPYAAGQFDETDRRVLAVVPNNRAPRTRSYHFFKATGFVAGMAICSRERFIVLTVK